MKGLASGAALLFAALQLAGAAAQGRLNLPQIRRLVTLPPATARALRTDLRPAAGILRPIPPKLEPLLIASMPAALRSACGEMIENWGEIARGSAHWQVRALHGDGDRFWLAFRCGSRAPEYKDDYDERPARLRLDTGTLEFFPLAEDAANDSTLYHLDFAEEFHLEGARAAAFKVNEPAENPCCDGPESRSGEHWTVFAETPSGMVELLSIVTARDDSSHSDDPEVDTETTYRAALDFERDEAQRVTTVTARFHEETREFTGEHEVSRTPTVRQRSGTLRYRWNPASLRFQEIK